MLLIARKVINETTDETITLTDLEQLLQHLTVISILVPVLVQVDLLNDLLQDLEFFFLLVQLDQSQQDVVGDLLVSEETCDYW